MTTTADAIVAGGGLIGLASAAAIAAGGGSVVILDSPRPGQASPAAAGMLAPSVERMDGSAHRFAEAARDRYPGYLDALAEATGIAVPLNRAGILQVAVSEAGVRGLRRGMPATATWLDAATLRAAEPGLAHALGAVHHPHDGSVDNNVLLAALTVACRASSRVRWYPSEAADVRAGVSSVRVRTADGAVHEGGRLVLAAGTWTPRVHGLPRPVPVTPLRGQMLAFAGLRSSHVLFGPRGYIVPRIAHGESAAETLVGATSERVGFDPSTTAAAADSLHAAGAEVIPSLSAASPVRHWAGLRPMTPDLLPIVGPDPDEPRLIYACGHSRNGILLAPLTGDCVAAFVLGRAIAHDISAFDIARFPSSTGTHLSN